MKRIDYSTRSRQPVGLMIVILFLLVFSSCVAPVATQPPASAPLIDRAGSEASYRGYTFSGAPAPDGTTVTFMSGMSPEQQRILREDARAFKEMTNIDLRIELGDDAKYNALLAAGNPPDIYYCETPGIRAADGTFMTIDDYVDDAFLSRFPEAFIEGYTGLDGKLYGIQIGGWFPVVMINTAMLAEAGVEPPGTDWTWSDVVAIGQQVTKDANGNTPLDPEFDPQNVETWGFFANWFADDIFPFANGARRMDPTGTRSLIDDPKFIEAWRWWSGLINEYQVQPPPNWFGMSGQSASELFFAGKLAMFADGLNYDFYRRGDETFGPGNWKMVAYPHSPDHDLLMARYQGGACISSQTENPQAAVEALKFLATAGFIWYPSLWLNDIDYVGYWEEQYPFLIDANYRDTVEFTLARVGPEPWRGSAAPFNLSRYTEGWDFNSNWSRVMNGESPFDDFDFAGYARQANEMVVAGMERDLEQTNLLPEWREALEELLAQRKAELEQ